MLANAVLATAQPQTPGAFVLVLAGSGVLVLAYLVRRHLVGRPLLPPYEEPFRTVRAGPTLLFFLLLLVATTGGLRFAFDPDLGWGGSVMGIGIALGAVLFCYERVVRPSLQPRATFLRNAGAGLLVTWAALPIIFGLFWILQKLGMPQVQDQIKLIRDREPGWITMVIVAVVVAPLAEEVGYRGLLYPALRRLSGPTVALVTSSVAFGLAHVSPPTVWAPLAIFGAFLAYLVESTGSIVPCVVAHMAFNAIAVAQLLLC